MSHPKLKKVENKLVPKSWGSETWLFNEEELCGKILTFNKGAKFSMHNHRDKYEFFWVLSGSVEVTGINTEDASQYKITLNEGETLEVPRRAFHQVEALEDSKIIEFSTFHSDSDSYRIFPGDSQK